jgi:branched-chain amino acid aminotransferase
MVLLNGKLIDAATCISANNRSFRYGDGFFETLLIKNGAIRFWDLHKKRIEISLQMLCFDIPKFFSTHKLETEIFSLYTKQKLNGVARVRVTFFRSDGGLFDAKDNYINYLIQVWDLPNYSNELNSNGWDLVIYDKAQKSCDALSNIKSNNYLHYALAAQYSKQHKCNDALILNTKNNIADSCIANLFTVINGNIVTPSLQEGCVAGVVRSFLIDKLKQQNYVVSETSISVEELSQASEIFLTNAIRGVVWVKRINEMSYTNFSIAKKCLALLG